MKFYKLSLHNYYYFFSDNLLLQFCINMNNLLMSCNISRLLFPAASQVSVHLIECI